MDEKQILSKYFPAPEVSADVLRRINEFEANMEYPVCDGVIEFLDALRAAGIPLAVVTSSSDNKMQREINQALKAGVDRIMLDNFTPERTREAVKLINGRTEVEPVLIACGRSGYAAHALHYVKHYSLGLQQ